MSASKPAAAVAAAGAVLCCLAGCGREPVSAYPDGLDISQNFPEYLEFVHLDMGAPELGQSGGDGMSVELKAVVPLDCYVVLNGGSRVRHGGVGRVELGKLLEACNDPTGFDVYVRTPPGQSGGFFEIDGKKTPVSPTGLTLIDTYGDATFRTLDLAYDTAGNPAPATLTFTAVAH